MADRSVLAGGVHGLKNQQQRIAIAGVELLLQVAEPRDMIGEERVIILLGAIDRIDPRRPILEIDLFAWP